jgi:hypothetical protein
MAYRLGNREQLGLLPASIEEYVGKEEPVRAYDAFVESLDFGELGGSNLMKSKWATPSTIPKR